MEIKKANFKRKLKWFLYFLVFYSGLLHLSFMLFKRLKKKHNAAILVYHQIVDKKSTDFLYKSPSVHHDIRDFKREISLMLRWFKIISMDEILDHLKRGKGFSLPSVALTFDDGYRDNYTLAYPIIRKYDLPATIYLITGLIGTNKRTWPDEIEYSLLNSKVKNFTFPPLFGEEIIDISSLERRRKANIRIAEALKKVNNKQKLELIDKLYHILKLNRNAGNHHKRRMLNWEEIKEMSKKNITFAAHTISHPIITQISFEDGKREISSSKDTIEEKTGKKVKHFAFPNGMAEDFTEEYKAFCVDIGFETIATAEYGILDNTSNPHFIRRFMPAIPIHFFAGEIAKLFFWSSKYKRGNEVYGKNKK